MGVKLGIVTTFVRALQFTWSLIYVIEIGSHVLHNSYLGGAAIDYQPLKALVGVGIAFFILSCCLNAFGIYSSFNGLRQSYGMRKTRVWLEVLNFFLWFMNIWIVFYAPKIPDIDADPEVDIISDALYWSNPWTVPTLMMNMALVALVTAETRSDNKATMQEPMATTTAPAEEKVENTEV